MTYPTCKTCQHWTQLEYMEPHEGDCALLVQNETRRDRVTLHDMDGSGVTFGPDFGCLHHEPKASWQS